METCPTCKGQGWLMHEDGDECPTCTPEDGSQIGGTGLVTEEVAANLNAAEKEPANG